MTRRKRAPRLQLAFDFGEPTAALVEVAEVAARMIEQSEALRRAAEGEDDLIERSRAFVGAHRIRARALTMISRAFAAAAAAEREAATRALGGARAGRLKAESARELGAAIEREWRQCERTGIALRDRAALVAKRLGVSATTVRRARRKIKASSS